MQKQSKIKPLRQSATLVLTFADSGADSHRLLMLNRKPHMSFSKALVFPGGVCEPEDELYAKSSSFIEYGKITAIRETFQQTKVLVCPPHTTPEQVKGVRGLLANSKQKDHCKIIGQLWSDKLSALRPIARFVTPQIPKMSRFDCIFYILEEGALRINLGTSSDLKQLDIQKEESSKYYWQEPIQYLEMFNKDQIFLPPPQNTILRVLHGLGKDKQANYISKMAKNIEIQPFFGQFSKDMSFILAGDGQYNLQLYLQGQPKSKSQNQVKETIKSISQLANQSDHRRICRRSATKSQIFFKSTKPGSQKTILRYLPPFEPQPKL